MRGFEDTACEALPTQHEGVYKSSMGGFVVTACEALPTQHEGVQESSMGGFVDTAWGTLWRQLRSSTLVVMHPTA